MAKMIGSFCEYTKAPKGQFDKRSFRYKQQGKAWVLIGCPKGQWSRQGVCKVGTKAHKLLVPAAKGKRCKGGGKRITKGL